MPGSKFHKYPLPTILTRVFFWSNPVAEKMMSFITGRVSMSLEVNCCSSLVLMIMIWVTVVQLANKIMASPSVMFRRQIWKEMARLSPAGEKPNSSRDHVECCQCWFAMLCLLWIYPWGWGQWREREKWSDYCCLVGGMTVWLVWDPGQHGQSDPVKILILWQEYFMRSNSLNRKCVKKQRRHLYLLSRLSTNWQPGLLLNIGCHDILLESVDPGNVGNTIWGRTWFDIHIGGILHVTTWPQLVRSDGRSSVHPWKIQGFVRADFHPR